MRDSVDMRKSINSFTILLNSDFNIDPSNGDGFVFYNKQKDKVKIFYFNENGFVIFYKRFEKIRLKLPLLISEKQKITYIQLMAFLSGFEIENLKNYQKKPTQNSKIISKNNTKKPIINQGFPCIQNGIVILFL